MIEVTDVCEAGGAGGAIGPGLATPPVVDGKGNIYVGVSNVPKTVGSPSGRESIVKLTSSKATPAGKVQYKSWREKRVNWTIISGDY